MANVKLIKQRIRSAKNISQITKAMQMVAASKMRKAQQAAISGRPYTEKIAEMVATFVKKIDPNAHKLLQLPESGKTLVVLITTNKGLLGGLNANLFRALLAWFSESELKNCVFVTIGTKGEQFVLRTHSELQADFSEIVPFVSSIPALTTLITEGFTTSIYKEVYLVYSNFISALRQEPTRKKILPITEFQVTETTDKQAELDFVVEPGIEAILDPLLFSYLENQVRDAVLEAEASEHSARMIAMKNATDNARELQNLLTLEYNKARQEKITYEIADIVTARLAFE